MKWCAVIQRFTLLALYGALWSRSPLRRSSTTRRKPRASPTRLTVSMSSSRELSVVTRPPLVEGASFSHPRPTKLSPASPAASSSLRRPRSSSARSPTRLRRRATSSATRVRSSNAATSASSFRSRSLLRSACNAFSVPGFGHSRSAPPLSPVVAATKCWSATCAQDALASSTPPALC